VARTNAPAAPWRNAITRYGEEAPDQLLANPRNPKIHPKPQQDALSGAITELGWLAPVIVNERTGHMLDGHARVGLAISRNEPSVPVAYVDLPEDQEALALATFDPIGNLAVHDKAMLDELLRDVSTGDAALQQMLADLAVREGVTPPPDEAWSDAFGGLPSGDRAPFQQMTFTVSDAQHETIKRALEAAKDAGDFVGTGNENSNGNALARLAEAYLGGR
jgi:hypothetical protein